MRSLIAPLVPAVLRHLEGYAEVAGEDAREAATLLARKLAAILIAAAATFLALLMTCVWLVALAWDTPWRNWVAAGLVLAFAGVALALALPVLRPGAEPPRFFTRIRAEFGRDRELLERTFDGHRQAANGEDDEHPAH
jgi:membrane protein implicated in regulation of membrane protease activity